MKLSLNQKEVLSKALFRERCRRSFHFFFKEFWDVNNKEPLVDSPHIKYLCDEAEKVVRRIVARQPKEYDLIINVPPGTSKSNIFSQQLEAWAWILDPTLQFITASHSHSLSLALSVKSRDIIQSEKFQKYFPEIELRRDVNAKSWFSNTDGGYRYTCTPGISPVGRHAHLIVVDDPIDPSESTTETARETINEWFKNTLPTRVVSKEVSAMILVMQRLHENDPAGFLLKENEGTSNIKLIKLPGKIDNNTRAIPREAEQIYQDNLLDPVRLGEIVLSQLRHRLGPYNYAGQIDQNPVPQTGGMFSVENLKITKTIPDRLVEVYRSWDKAGTEGGGCNTAGVKMAKMANGDFIILDCVFGQWRADKREAIIRQIAELDGRSVKIVIEQEGGSGGKESAEATVRNLSGFVVKVDRPSGEKAARAEPFSTQVNIGNVWILEGAWNTEYIEELRLFPRGKFKDQVDASSQAFAALVGKSRIDYRKMMSPRSEKSEVNGIFLP